MVISACRDDQTASDAPTLKESGEKHPLVMKVVSNMNTHLREHGFEQEIQLSLGEDLNEHTHGFLDI
ncbi:hypothetical protein CYMTET_31113 [Cymbomonas tetramitiformis]|uniref:Uncharacterized protein n=1 Tax=Cymbomonas tetramitiformis TaxID=36881 RepID=A0AAE0FHL9_9CHLO|nr:hypothetical protein CYMTET_31113 [Cymbomonas tetramitiformis]